MKRYLKEDVMRIIFLITAIISIVAVVLICFFLFANGVPAMAEVGLWNMLSGKTWAPVDNPPQFGILPMILGSLYVTAGAIIIGVPIGVFTAVFMAYSCPKKIYPFLKGGINLLAGIPSVVYGFFGIAVIVPAIRNIFGGTGSSILAAAILLGIMILPTIISICETAIRAVPKEYYQGAMALGGSHYYSVFFVVLPAAKSGVFTAIVMGIGRAIGETMAVIMVAGNQARMPNSMFRGVRTLTANIVLEMGYAADLHRNVLIATGVVLFVFILIINTSFDLIKKRSDKK